MSNEKEEVWTMPPVKPADRVYVGKQPAQVKDPDLRLIGFVTRVGSETVDIVTFAPGPTELGAGITAATWTTRCW